MKTLDTLVQNEIFQYAITVIGLIMLIFSVYLKTTLGFDILKEKTLKRLMRLHTSDSKNKIEKDFFRVSYEAEKFRILTGRETSEKERIALIELCRKADVGWRRIKQISLHLKYENGVFVVRHPWGLLIYAGFSFIIFEVSFLIMMIAPLFSDLSGKEMIGILVIAVIFYMGGVVGERPHIFCD